jgi:catalase
MMNPQGRANYEPNSWSGETSGPRESFEKGFTSYPAHEEGEKLRVRSETFADHYSQARQFYISQTEVEQSHIAAALTFELGKVERLEIRARIVSHLLNIDDELAKRVAEGLRLRDMPKAADAAKPTNKNLPKSPALSILQNGPERFKGRKLGALVTDGVDIQILRALETALKEDGAQLEIVAPKVGGVKASDGSWIEAAQAVDGGPSVLYDAVALLPSAEGANELLSQPAARDFVADAFAHMKFIGHVHAAAPLLAKAGVSDQPDAGMIALNGPQDCPQLVAACRKLRDWTRAKTSMPSQKG